MCLFNVDITALFLQQKQMCSKNLWKHRRQQVTLTALDKKLSTLYNVINAEGQHKKIVLLNSKIKNTKLNLRKKK